MGDLVLLLLRSSAIRYIGFMDLRFLLIDARQLEEVWWSSEVKWLEAMFSILHYIIVRNVFVLVWEENKQYQIIYTTYHGDSEEIWVNFK